MTHLAAALFFASVLLAAAVAVHMTVRAHWNEILLALKGELGRSSSYRIVPGASGQRPLAYATVRRRAAF